MNREPQPIERLEFLRMLAPLATLGFLMSRFIHVQYWLTEIGFVVPEQVSGDYRQPLYIPPIPVWLAVVVAYLALADRLEAFTVNKLGTVLAIALFASPAGARYSIDALRDRGTRSDSAPIQVSWGNVRFFQTLLIFIYFASGIAKIRGGWLKEPLALFSHLHDSYQTAFTYFMARTVPGFGWTLFQYVALIYEVGAPLWFMLRRTRQPALVLGLGMHAMIGIMFGPVIWFSLLMSVLLLSSFAPLPWLSRVLGRVWPAEVQPQTALKET